MKLSKILGFSLLILAAGMTSTAFAAADLIGPQLKAQVEKARPSLGDLPSWQEEIFQNEILPWSSRFVRDYKTSGNQVTKADVDLQGIKRYLSFTASQILKPEATKILLFVRAQPSCSDCVKAVAGIRADLKARLERRGFLVLLPTADELRSDASDAYSRRNASGYVTADVRAEEDADHAGEQRYILALDLRFPGTIASTTQKQMEIMPSDSIEVSMSRLAIDAVLEIGGKARNGFVSTVTDTPGVEVTIQGATSFKILAQVKTKLQAALGTDYKVVEKHIERGGVASLAVLAGSGGEAATSSVADGLKKTPYDGFTLQVQNVGSGRVDVRIAGVAKGERS